MTEIIVPIEEGREALKRSHSRYNVYEDGQPVKHGIKYADAISLIAKRLATCHSHRSLHFDVHVHPPSYAERKADVR